MRRLFQSCSVILVSFCTVAAYAHSYDYTKEDLSGYNLEPNFKMANQSGFSRSGKAFYLFAGYQYAYRFLANTTKTISGPTGSVSFVPQTSLPGGFNGIGVGFGKEFTRNIDYQMEYIQHFSETKTSNYRGNAYSMQVKMTGVLADVAYDFNPDDQFQVLAKAGATIFDYNNSYTVNSVEYFSPNNATLIDPAVGLDLLFQFDRHSGIRVGTVYVADVQNANSHGEIDVLAGFNYVL